MEMTAEPAAEKVDEPSHIPPAEESDCTFASMVQALRRRACLDIETLARRVGILREQLADVEAGDRSMQGARLQRLIDTLTSDPREAEMLRLAARKVRAARRRAQSRAERQAAPLPARPHPAPTAAAGPVDAQWHAAVRAMHLLAPLQLPMRELGAMLVRLGQAMLTTPEER